MDEQLENFMASLRIILSFLILASCSAVHAQDVIGLSLPLSGRLSPVAERIEFGALAAVARLNSQGRDIKLVLVDDGCHERNIPRALEKLRSEKAKIVVGPTCFEIARQLAASLAGQDGNHVPVIALNTRNPLLDRYRNNEGLPLYEISNAPDAEAKAVVAEILPRFEGKPFAILDDGSVYGRGLADHVRILAQEAGLPPIAVANFRPLQTTQASILRRMKRSGAEAIFLAASPEDIVTIFSDLKNLQFDWIVGTGEAALLLPFALNAGVVPDGLLTVRPGDLPTADATELLEQLKNDKVVVEDSLLLGHALVEIAAAAIQSDQIQLDGRVFETIVGPLGFGDNGRAIAAPYGLFRWKNGAFRPVPAK